MLEKNTKTNTKTKNWKTKTLLLFFVFFSSVDLLAQQYYPLHPSVGDTIERIEKLDYALFPKVKNPKLSYCLIDFKESGYKLLAFYESKENYTEYALSQEEIIEAQQNIEKINAFYRRKAKADSLEAKQALYPNRPSGKKPTYTQGPLSERAKKEARMYIRLQEDRRRMQEHRRGIQPNRMNIELR